MNYKVLYRKYRPTDFDSIIAQDQVINILRNSVKNNKISHAYIFSGPRGTGKTTTARVFAKYINCLNPNDSGPCGECDMCKLSKENVDVIEIDAASNNGVDEIREIINNVKIAPAYSKYKVYIVDEVHMLSQSAFNALLLTLEEPPSNVVFIFATTNIENVPITILSRCQRFDFKKVNEESMYERLKDIAVKEKIKIEDDALRELVYLADGGMRDALSLLDQIAFDNDDITYDIVVKNLGIISNKKIRELIECIYEENPQELLNILNEIQKLNIDFKHFIKKLIDEIENIAIDIKLGKLDYDYDKNVSLAFDLADLLNKVNVNINSYSLLTIVLLKYVGNNTNPKPSVKQDTQKDDATKAGNNQINNIVKKEVKDYANLKKVRVNNCFVNAKKSYLTNIQQSWSKFVGSISENKKIMMLMVDSDVVAASDKYLIITNELESTSNMINSCLEELEKLIYKVYNIDYKIVSLSNDEWSKEKKQYIENIKNNYTYKMMSDDNMEVTLDNVQSSEEIASSIFDKSKIVIEEE
ncbi:MAG: DNA polymerase III subunit gamma/tau [Bacilli bacterium]|nr:DNA polymerase III subunit gamma/tau [Bacilli bacterium]